MINYRTYETVKLKDIAEFERAKNGYVYPKGTSALQISVTKGQICYLNEPSTIGMQYVAIIPIASINPEFFNIMLHRNIDAFLIRYQKGLNVKEKDVGEMVIQLPNKETQDHIVQTYRLLESETEKVERELVQYKNLKSTLLDEMFVS